MKVLRVYLLLLFSFAIFSCSGKTDGFAPSIELAASVVISPNAITLAVNNTTTFTASGGSGSYSYSVMSGSGSILGTTGNYTAAGVAGTAVVRVVDGQGKYADAIVTVNTALQISPTSQSLSLNSTQAFSATGGVTPITFSLASGLGSVDSTGLYTASSTPGTTIVRATDSLGNTSDATVNVYGALGISPTSATVAVNNTVAFSAGGGVGPYSYSIFSGTGSINATTGFFTAPAVSGSVTVRVTDSLGATSNAVVTVNGALQISPTAQTVLINGSVAFATTGGVPSVSFSLVSGTGSINSGTGVYTAPAANGSAVVRATDSYGNTSDASVTITTTLSISPTSKSLAVNNIFTFTGTGGTPPLAYSVFSGTGAINASSGAYTAPATSGVAVIRVTDSLGATADANVTINPALSITPTAQTIAINGTMTFSSAGGVVPYTYSIFSGAGTINAATGAYTAPGSVGTDIVRVTDSLGNTANATVTINNLLGISPAAITLAVNNTTTFAGNAGSPPYTFSIFSGGGSINAGTGLFTAPAVSGTTVVRVTDSFSSTANATVTINPALAISPATKILAVNNVFTFTATGGVSPYTYSVLAGGGGSINATSGAYIASATSGTATVRVTDGYGNISNAAVTINNALAISPAAPTITVVDTQTFSSTGGVSPYTYSVASGTGSINAGTGLYTPAGAGTVTIRSTDSIGNTSDAALMVNTALAITPTTGYVIVNNDFTFDFTGGVPPVTYTITVGLGTIVDPTIGIYTAPTTTGSATIRVTDAFAHTSDATLTIYNGLTISPTSVTLGINTTQTFTGAGGVGTRTFAMFSGTGTINASTGLYAAPAGSGNNVVQVSDTIGNVATAAITVVSSLTITPSTLKLPLFSTATFTSVLGVPGYTYSVPTGTGTVVPATGVYTAASVIGSGTVRTTDSALSTSNSALTHIEPVEMTSGSYHTCVRYNENSVKCWGDAASGQLGNGSTADLGDAANEGGGFLPFVNLGTGRTAKALATGISHTCAILDTNNVKCWGYNLYGQLGQGSTANLGDGPSEMGDSLANVNLGTGRTATQIFAFGYETCAILDNATTKCWGRNTYGQLARGDINDRGDAANEMGDNLTAINFGTGRTATKLTGGLDFMCALLDNATVKCFGRSNRGQLGYGNTNSIGDGSLEVGDGVAAVNLGTGRTVVELASGYSHSCAILDNSTMKCWGRNESGQLGQGNILTLGDGAGEMGDALIAVSLGTGFVPSKVWGARQGTCALSGGGVLKCFGLNTSGQLLVGSTAARGDGAGEMGDALVAANMGTGFTVSAISTGYYNSCVLTSTKRIKCWGVATNGALLNATTTTNLGDAAGELGDSLPWVNH